MRYLMLATTIAGAAAAVMAVAAAAQTVPGQTLDGKYRGGYVCGKLPTTRGVLRVPLDLVVRGDSVQFARPLFDLGGTRVLGSELASGTIDGNGNMHLTSSWSYLGNIAEAEYDGTLTAHGGTLTGTQTWRSPDPDAGPAVSRTCTAALVPSDRPAGAVVQ